MFDTTNQTETTLNKASDNNFGEILDEIIKEKLAEISESGDELELISEEGENRSPDTDDGRYRVVYNGKEMFLDLEELKTNAQKGLNYDHVKNEYDILRAQPGARELLRDARESGLSSQAYLSQQKLRDKRSRVEDLMRRGISEREAMYVTDLEDRLENERLEAERKKPYYEFMEAYPDVDPKAIPEEVWHQFHAGMNLVAAYALYENAKLKDEAKMMRQNDDSRKRSSGSAVGSAAENVPDSFLQGLFG